MKSMLQAASKFFRQPSLQPSVSAKRGTMGRIFFLVDIKLPTGHEYDINNMDRLLCLEDCRDWFVFARVPSWRNVRSCMHVDVIAKGHCHVTINRLSAMMNVFLVPGHLCYHSPLFRLFRVRWMFVFFFFWKHFSHIVLSLSLKKGRSECGWQCEGKPETTSDL